MKDISLGLVLKIACIVAAIFLVIKGEWVPAGLFAIAAAH